MARPLVGHLDPSFLAVVEELQDGLRRLFGTANRFTIPISATGSAGMEACFVNLLEPGDRVVVGVAGVFGERMCDVATRIGARVSRVETEPGTPLDPDSMVEAIERTRPSVVAFVHAETSTGVLQPVEPIAEAARAAGALVILDCVTSLAGLPVRIDDWGIDAAYAATQKCLSAPPGLAPLTFSEHALARIERRRTPVQSWYLDATLLSGYFGSQRAYHHTAPISSIFALAEAVRVVEEEGQDARFARHRQAAAGLVSAVAPFGLEPLVPEAHRLPMLTTLRLPEALVEGSEAGLRRRLLEVHAIEVGGGLGKLAGRIWRVGLMGENARPTSVERLRAALESELS
jgi:alanine-glyoxylate transaminase/serine-glyoxylate transaminase/serine-pyruvate transaminase